MRKRTRIAVIALIVALGFGASGLAWAYFSETTNAVAGGGANGNMSALVNGTAEYTYDNDDDVLFPGHSAAVKIPLTNDNPVAVEIISIVPGAPAGTCASELEFSLAGAKLQTTGGVDVTGWQIPADTTYHLVLPAGVKLKTSATNACEGTAFSTTWTINAENR